MAVSADYLAYILDQLRGNWGHSPFPHGWGNGECPQFRARRMFGGIGLYADGFFFGIIDDTVYFKVDDSNRRDYQARNCRQFSFEMEKAGRRIVSMGYFAVPEEVLEDPDELKLWARKSLAVAVAATADKAKPKVATKPTSRKR